MEAEFDNEEWGEVGTSVPGTQLDFGKGAENTDLIVTDLSESAAHLCDNLVHNGYSDWFLPSKDELNAIWDNLVDDGSGGNSGVGGFAHQAYWSSSESDADLAWGQDFGNGDQWSYAKDGPLRVRAVRAFTQ